VPTAVVPSLPVRRRGRKIGVEKSEYVYSISVSVTILSSQRSSVTELG
jgi:hypothetical protein